MLCFISTRHRCSGKKTSNPIIQPHQRSGISQVHGPSCRMGHYRGLSRLDTLQKNSNKSSDVSRTKSGQDYTFPFTDSKQRLWKQRGIETWSKLKLHNFSLYWGQDIRGASGAITVIFTFILYCICPSLQLSKHKAWCKLWSQLDLCPCDVTRGHIYRRCRDCSHTRARGAPMATLSHKGVAVGILCTAKSLLDVPGL